MTERLFIYGTLAPGRSNHHHMVDIPGDWQPATLRGRLYEEGWGAAAGYPAIVPGEDGDPDQHHKLGRKTTHRPLR